MRNDEIIPFTELLDSVCSLLSRGTYMPDPKNSLLFFRALDGHTFDAVRAAFSAHVKDPIRGRFIPVPADIIAQMGGDDGRLGADEAWAIAIQARDESQTIVWNDEIAQAYGVAQHVLDVGDEVGARMAFKAAYARIVEGAKAAGIRPKESYSLGHDINTRNIALKGADALMLAAPVTLNQLSAKAPPEVRERLSALRVALVCRDSP